jgi:Putative quorum-sensing-regulated virulence factor
MTDFQYPNVPPAGTNQDYPRTFRSGTFQSGNKPAPKLSSPRPENCLGDEDPMPFGKHKGVPMKFVPPGYLDWLGEQDWIKEENSRHVKLRNYIQWRRNAIDLEMEREQRARATKRYGK